MNTPTPSPHELVSLAQSGEILLRIVVSRTVQPVRWTKRERRRRNLFTANRGTR